MTICLTRQLITFLISRMKVVALSGPIPRTLQNQPKVKTRWANRTLPHSTPRANKMSPVDFSFRAEARKAPPHHPRAHSKKSIVSPVPLRTPTSTRRWARPRRKPLDVVRRAPRRRASWRRSPRLESPQSSSLTGCTLRGTHLSLRLLSPPPEMLLRTSKESNRVDSAGLKLQPDATHNRASLLKAHLNQSVTRKGV